MLRRFPFPKDDGKDDIKRRLNSWIEKQNLTEEETYSALEAILNQRKNIALVKKNAKNAGLKLERFISNKALEIYYDLLKKTEVWGIYQRGGRIPDSGLASILSWKRKRHLLRKSFIVYTSYVQEI